MTLFVQCSAGALVAAILGLALEKQGKDMALLLTVGVSVMILAVAISYLAPVMAFLEELRVLGNFSSEMVSALLKILGMGILTEAAAMVCADAGNSSLAKALQLLGSMVILWLSIPIFSALMDLVREILGGL